jgi:uncharacterized protein (TIGR02996 family)
LTITNCKLKKDGVNALTNDKEFSISLQLVIVNGQFPPLENSRLFQEDGLLEAIRSRPADLGLRLVYADWLEEHGHPQAELIRIQCTLERLPAGDRRRGEWQAREKEWLARHQADLLGPLPSLAYTWTVRRGFVERVAVNVNTFLSAAEEVCRAAPVAAIELFGQFKRWRGDRGARALARCPLLARVTSLDLEHNLLTVRGVRSLAASPYGRRLTALQLARNLLGDEGVALLARSRLAGRLKHLDLTNNAIGDDGLEALTHARGFRRLCYLDLKYNSLTNRSALALARGPFLRRLTTLNLAGNVVGDGGAEALATSPHLPRLTGLDLSHNFITDNGVRSLARCPALARLRGLNLSNNFLTHAGYLAWASSPYIHHLLPPERVPD